MEEEVIRFGDPELDYVCDAGFTLGGTAGGDREFGLQCEADGDFSSAPNQCAEPRVSVSGQISDAQNAQRLLSGVTVTFRKNGVVVSTTTSDRSGRYTANVPMGLLAITGAKAGYIDQHLDLNVAGRVRQGQGADLALSAVLPPGAYRVVLTWGAHSRDLDSHTYFGSGLSTHVYWPSSRRHFVAPGTGGLEATLDRDDVDGYGPETTSFANVGQCTTPGRCLLKFKVKNYSYNDGEICNSQAVITVYRGDTTLATFQIQPGCGTTRNNYHTVFTLDSTRGIDDAHRIIPGDR